MTAVSHIAPLYGLSDDHLAFRDVIRQIVAERVAPRAAEIDAVAQFPADVRDLFAAQDLFALPFDAQHGGTGTGTLMLCVAIEEVAKVCASSSLMLAVQDLGALPIRLAGSDELKQRVLPRLASGEWLAAFALSEPDAGSDPGAMRTLDHSRLGIAAQALGIAQGATDYAVAYARGRIAFRRPIIDLQGIQFKLADMEIRCAAGRELLYRAAAKAERHEHDLGKYSAMAKLFCSDTAMAVTVEAVQVLGGYGYVTDYPVERMMRDAKLTQIYEGTNEIQRLVIARSLAKAPTPS
jgi:alkylation response protein AidB-like acyl-CoA dehydrogenase